VENHENTEVHATPHASAMSHMLGDELNHPLTAFVVGASSDLTSLPTTTSGLKVMEPRFFYRLFLI
jgi:hypothetical protein